MDYRQLFRSLREARNLTLEQLAATAGVHRNTVVNIESGRPVKFKTIATLMQKMGYATTSTEMKSIALLWIESVSGIPLSHSKTGTSAKKAITTFRSPARHAARSLENAVLAASLSPKQIELLAFAARHPDVLAILESVRNLVADLPAATPRASFREAAEDPGNYDKK